MMNRTSESSRRFDGLPHITVLLSGGIRSALCLADYLHQGLDVSALHVQYGQAAAVNERRAALAIAKHYAVDLRVLELSGGSSKPPGEIVGRNAFLISAAAMEFRHTSGVIAIGLDAETPSFDCSLQFYSDMERILDGYTGGQLKIAAPFAAIGKDLTWQLCKARRVPIDLTYSCEASSDEPCGVCLSCLDRKALLASEHAEVGGAAGS